MRAFLTLTCGTVGATFITAAGIITVLFAGMGHAGDLGRSALTLAAWCTGFGVAFLTILYVGLKAGVLQPTGRVRDDADAPKVTGGIEVDTWPPGTDVVHTVTRIPEADAGVEAAAPVFPAQTFTVTPLPDGWIGRDGEIVRDEAIPKEASDV